MQINQRFSPIGCSKNSTFANSKDSVLAGSELFKLPGTLSWENGKSPKKDKLAGKVELSVAGVTQGSGNYFYIKNSAEFVKNMNEGVCGKEKCPKSDLKNVPSFSFMMECDGQNDRISHMKMEIQGKDYAYYNGINHRIEYLIGEYTAASELSEAENKSTTQIAVGRMFLNKYPLFIRAGGDDAKFYSAGFGDVEYVLDTKFWLMITALVSLGFVLSMAVVACLHKEGSNSMNSTFDAQAEITKGGDDDWNASGNGEEYAKV